MALTTVPLLREDSIIAWDIEATFKTAPAAAQWQSLGRVEEWVDLGLVKNVFRDAIAGSGREAATIGVAGTGYKPTTIGPFQIVDPRIMAFAWGQELVANGPNALGGGYYRHKATPTTNGRLPSMGIQMADYKSGVRTDGITYLGVIMPRISIRGEEVGESGEANTGRIMMAPTFLPHDHSTAVAAKTISLPSSTPYYKQHASIQFYNSDTDWRIHSWEFTVDNHARHNYYHNNAHNGKPFEAPPEGIIHDLRMDIVSDGHQNLVSGSILRDLWLNETKGQAQIKYIRTANQDEWAINLTDVQISEAPIQRRRGKNHYEIQASVRATSFEWVDQNVAAYFPT